MEFYTTMIKWVDINGIETLSYFHSKGNNEEQAEKKSLKMFERHIKRIYNSNIKDIDIEKTRTDIVVSGFMMERCIK